MRLNKYIFSSVVLCGSVLFSSCELDREPLDTYSELTEGVSDSTDEEVVFKDKAAVESYLLSIYNLMKDRQEHWYVDMLLIAEAHSDNAYAGTTGAEVVPFEDNSIEGSNSVLSRDWTRYLEDIGKANRLICNIDAVVDESFSTEERNNIKAQALIFRSLVMFDMVRLWGNIPVITTVADDITSDNIGDIYDDYFPEQKTPVEVYKQIEADLLEALKYAPDNNPEDKTKFSKSVAKALLAKVYAEKPIRDYSKVIKYCDELVSDGFDLQGDYSDLFAMNEETTDIKFRNTKESILEAQFFTGGGNWCSWMFGRDLLNWDSNFTWAKWVTPSRDLINAFNRAGDVKRKEQAIVYYECTWSNYYPSNEYPFMYKCRSANSSLIKLRFADILLLKAEAYIFGDSQDLDMAADIIDKVRNRVGLAKLSDAVRSDRNAMIDAYLNERRLELAFEGQRWFDLCRLDKVEEVMNNVYSVDNGRKARVYPFNSNSYYIAIPQDAIDQNPNLKQNLGY